ncbi:hypothetical protein GCM10010129_51560 [Streptomyces fumigatiscleroticus]|nr:hypothetical protein GCM10010129_51560 [Streptomyces fumigatiscleroticus]
MTAPVGLRDIEARHPALRGAKSPMHAIHIKTAATEGARRARPVPHRGPAPLRAPGGGRGATAAPAVTDLRPCTPSPPFTLLTAEPAVVTALTSRPDRVRPVPLPPVVRAPLPDRSHGRMGKPTKK